jgi:hypothetical protein
MSTLAPRTGTAPSQPDPSMRPATPGPPPPVDGAHPSPGPSFVAAALGVRRALGEQVVVTQSRCVDALLDLFNLTAEPSVRSVLSDFLAEISGTSAVTGTRLRHALDLALAANHVEGAYAGLLLG